MTEQSAVLRVHPAELPDLLNRLADEQATRLALIGRGVTWLADSSVDWPKDLQGHVVVRMTGARSGLPRELLRLSCLQSLALWEFGVTDENVAAIVENFGQLTSLDLGSNNVSDRGAHAIAEQLDHLTSLKLYNNSVSDSGAREIARNLGHLTSLDLGYNRLGETGARAICEHLGQLTSLNLTNARIGDDGALAIAENLGKLSALTLVQNELSETGTRAIAERLGSLTLLRLADNHVGDAGAKAIAEHLGKLNSLNLAGNGVGGAGTRTIAEQLGQLNDLDLSGNPVGDAGVRAIARNLRQLTRVYLYSSQVGDEAVATIAQSLEGLVKLGLGFNPRVTTIEPLVGLTSLRVLSVPKTGVADLSPWKDRILAGLPVKWSTEWWRGSGIYVEDCPLTHPPPEVAAQGTEAVLNYFNELEAQGVDRLFEAKLLIVGEGGAGKTSLVRRMFMPELDLPTEDETTRGIEIHRHEFPISEGRSYKLNTWDFGGQQIYHATHQFFLTRRSLYVLVDDTRSDHQSIHDDGFKFWLEVVETLSEGSPLLIFQNEKGGRSKQLDEAGIRGRYPNVQDIQRGNLEHPGAADGLRQALEYFAQRLPHIGENVPAQWVAIREDLEGLSQTRPYISLGEYFEVYGRHLNLEREKALHLSRYLHDLGVFLHFQHPRELRRTVFLRNRWVTAAVFRVLDDERVKSRRGRFTLADCDRLWIEQGHADKEVELRALMVRFELCYRLQDTDEEMWLVPQHLSPSKPPELNDWSSTGDLVHTYRYEFLPRGMVSRLIVRMHRFVKQPELCWSNGALFEHEGTQVLVETVARGNEIALRCRGREQKELLSVIASDLEALNDSFLGLRDKVEQWVPCICEGCARTIDPAMFSQLELLQRRAHNKLTIECSRPPYRDVSVIELLDGQKLEQLPFWAEEPVDGDDPFAVAVSFPGEDRAFVLQVVERLAEVLGRDRVFYDEWHEARLLGSGGDLKLQDFYEQAGLVIPFFSEHYAKPWCSMEWETVRGILLNRRQDDAVIPVHLDDTEIRGWPAVGFGIRLKGRSAEQIADLILLAYRERGGRISPPVTR